MITIKIIILYFIQITHTDFTSTGARLVIIMRGESLMCDVIEGRLDGKRRMNDVYD